ncbi:MAG: IS1595 family transposase [Chitinophagales bacterium]
MMLGKEYNTIIDVVQAFPDKKTCIIYLEKLLWNSEIPISPFDSSSKVYKCKNNRYKCKNSGKYFNVLHGTIFENTNLSLQKWFVAIWLVTSNKKGISSLQLARDLNITQKSSWFMLHRIRYAFKVDTDKLQNEVEIDETYVGGKNKNRHANKKVPNSQGRSHVDKTPVLGMIERNGKIKATVVKNVRGKTLIPEIEKVVKQGTTIYTDEWRAYGQLYKLYNHKYVKHNVGEYVNGRVHTNTIEGFWSLLKRSIMGMYHFVSRKHLQRYVDAMVFIYNNRNLNQNQRFNMAFLNVGSRLTYKDLINK